MCVRVWGTVRVLVLGDRVLCVGDRACPVCGGVSLCVGDPCVFLVCGGPLGPVFSLFVPFYSSIPKVPVTQLLGQISITNKSLVYIVGLQLLTSSPYMWLVALSGLISGKLYHSNALRVQRLLFLPRWLSRVGAFLLEPLFSGLPPPNDTPLGMGATLDIQRQQRMDLHDQQMLLAQFNQARRNHRPPQQPHPTPQQLHPTAPPLQLAPTAPPLDNTPVAEEQVARLMEMGFSRIDAQDALRASNNDINVATNFLLQHLG
ncbi:unnamed protein product [Coregonus sp. 'balchen']|nr:unnamed protein product [Coregonus sp. 'balchen']